MASQSSAMLFPCELCLEEHKYFKLMESIRPPHLLPRGNLDKKDKYKRVCVKCEVELRKLEWSMMTEYEKDENPNFTDEAEVRKVLKKNNRGKTGLKRPTP